MAKSQPSILIGKLNQFIRKYYMNQLIRGTLIGVGMLAALYLLFVLAEYIFRMNMLARTILFYGYLVYGVFVLIWWIIIPLAKVYRWMRGLTYEEAAVIIGRHFPEIEDKLLNTLQLMKMSQKEEIVNPLILASVEQKTNKLKPFEFRLVIHYRKNLKYLAYAIPPFIMILAGLLLSPDLVSEPTRRIISHQVEFEKPAPFQITIMNPDLIVFQRENFDLQVEVSGEIIPAELYIETNSVSQKMKKESPTRFSYLFRALRDPVEFYMSAAGYRSPVYQLRVLPRPTILEFTTELIYPEYTGKSKEIMKNTGDLVLPEGTKVIWQVRTRDVDTLWMLVNDSAMAARPGNANEHSFISRFTESLSYSMVPSNPYVPGTDTLTFRIITIPDAYPVITIEQSIDSSMSDLLFHTGMIKDDYGFSRLLFWYDIIRADTVRREENISIPVCSDCREQQFFFNLDLEETGLQPGEIFRYYMEIWDNDGIRGPKATRTALREIRRLTKDEMENLVRESQQQIGNEIKNTRETTDRMEKGIDDLQKKMLEKRELDWQERKEIGEMLERSEEIMENIEQVKREIERNLEKQEEYEMTEERILEKQRRLQELMDKMMTEELRKLVEEIEKLLEQADKEKLQEMLKEMKITASELEDQLDRNLELFRQLEFERKLSEEIENLRELSKEENNLAEENPKSKEIGEEALKKQEELQQRYDSVRQNLTELEKLEEDIESPIGLEKTKTKQDSIAGSLQEASEKLKEKDRKGTVGKQKKSAEQMEQLADQIEMMQMDAEMEQYEEDARQIRQILENLLTVSFEQEELLNRTKNIQRSDPSYLELIANQKELNEKLQSARDSLQAIGRRQFMIEPVITRELGAIKAQVDGTVEALNDRNISMALSKQQFILTSLNTLAVLLEEAMQQMNQNMNMMMQGKSSSMCQNPSSGKGKKSMKNIKSMQEQLAKEMERMKKGLEEQKSGQQQKGKPGEQGMTEQIARMAAQQEAIRQEMQKYTESLKEQGIGNNGENEAIREMEKAEDDLLNKRITRESLQRQQQILSRLLQSEKAEMEREQQKERKSNEAKMIKRSNPLQELEYKRVMGRQQEVIQYKPLPLNYKYKGRANQYLMNIIRP